MRIARTHFLLGLCFAVLFAGGCATYMVGNEKFSSSDKALQRQSEILATSLARVTLTSQPVQGRALVLLPSPAEIERHYIQIRGNPAQFTAEQINYLKTFEDNNFQFVANTIKRRGIFSSVTVARHDGNPAGSAMDDYDYLIYADVDGWFIQGKGDKQANQIHGAILPAIEDFTRKHSGKSP